MLEEVRTLARSAEALDTHDTALRSDVAPPRLRGTRFDGEATRARSRQHTLAIWRGLRIERFATRHGHEAYALAGGLQFLDGVGGKAHFRTRGDHDGFRGTVAVDEHIAALAQRDQLFRRTRLLRQALAREDQRCRTVLALECR